MSLAAMAPSFDVVMECRPPNPIAHFVKRMFLSVMSTRYGMIMACVQHHGYTGVGNYNLIAERIYFTKMTVEIRPTRYIEGPCFDYSWI